MKIVSAVDGSTGSATSSADRWVSDSFLVLAPVGLPKSGGAQSGHRYMRLPAHDRIVPPGIARHATALATIELSLSSEPWRGGPLLQAVWVCKTQLWCIRRSGDWLNRRGTQMSCALRLILRLGAL
jgi:hypothetical protein